ncbi:response regulator transcription factor [Enterobacter sp. Ap-916]|uniref:response regulator transcription factor n=1 Tax=Enterobacteriaceae TaxID=543 RepID=UPI00141EAAA4|nr:MULTISPECIES: response regulator transcription factor [unclassified Enterobacter]NIF58015.1 response regulator transcription factor [Enterobacter sp. Ap-867]NIG28043.1 response regulator transcription factor [Enterobacter sp. Ap-916]
MEKNIAEGKAVAKSNPRVLIFDPCGYAAFGLARLCESELESQVIGTPQTLPHFLELMIESKPDMVICGIDPRANVLPQLLNMPYYPSCRYVLLTDAESVALSRALQTAGFYAVIDKSMPLRKLTGVLRQALVNPSRGNIRRDARFYLPEERYILGALLNGDRLALIARKMGIPYRAVSRYKHTALRRAGLKSINQILSA